MAQTFTVFMDDPTTVKTKTVKVLTLQLVTSYGHVCAFFCSLALPCACQYSAAESVQIVEVIPAVNKMALLSLQSILFPVLMDHFHTHSLQLL